MQCDRGHSFDIAAQGYVNLLLVNQKASLAPGDTKQMAVSRRTFLKGGYFAPLSERINNAVRADFHHDRTAPGAVLDAGCGEGYYLNSLIEVLPAGSDGYGIDISKEAIKLAASAHKNIRFAVASIHQELPFPSCSMSSLLNVFAPRNPTEFARVLRPGGSVITVVPAGGHLAELHRVLGIAPIEHGKDQRVIIDFDNIMTRSNLETLRYRRLVPSSDVLHLIQMTPTFWHLSDDAQAQLINLPAMEIEFAFTIVTLRHI